jgi:hypothetical protein
MLKLIHIMAHRLLSAAEAASRGASAALIKHSAGPLTMTGIGVISEMETERSAVYVPTGFVGRVMAMAAACGRSATLTWRSASSTR